MKKLCFLILFLLLGPLCISVSYAQFNGKKYYPYDRKVDPEWKKNLKIDNKPLWEKIRLIPTKDPKSTPSGGFQQGGNNTIKNNDSPVVPPPTPPPVPTITLCQGNVSPVVEEECPELIEMGPDKPYGNVYNAFIHGHQNCPLEVESSWAQGEVSIITGNEDDLVTVIDGKNTSYTIITCDGDDVVHSGLGENTIDTSHGNDRVTTHGGVDTITLGEGNDTANTQDGKQDTIYAVQGEDNLQVDNFDKVIY